MTILCYMQGTGWVSTKYLVCDGKGFFKEGIDKN